MNTNESIILFTPNHIIRSYIKQDCLDTIIKYFEKYKDILDKTKILDDACYIGNIEFIKWLSNMGYIEDSYKAFYICCIRGHLQIAVWLHDKYNIDISRNNHNIFYQTCKMNKWWIASWLHTLTNINLYSTFGGIECMRNNNNQYTMEWLEIILQHQLSLFIPKNFIKVNDFKHIKNIDDNCVICWQNKINILLGCNVNNGFKKEYHEFHFDCITKWLLTSKSCKCPMCNTNINPHNSLMY